MVPSIHLIIRIDKREAVIGKIELENIINLPLQINPVVIIDILSSVEIAEYIGHAKRSTLLLCHLVIHVDIISDEGRVFCRTSDEFLLICIMIGVERRVGVFVIGTLRCKSEHDAPFGIFPNALSIDYFLATLLHRAIEIDIGLIHTLEISLHDIVGSGVRFGDLVATSTGKTPARGDAVYWSSNDYPWVSISDMKQGGIIETTKEFVSQKAADDCFHGQISTKGTLIMSFKLTVGRTSILGIDAYHNEAIISIKTYADNMHYTRDYLSYILPIIANSGDSKDAIKGKTLNSKSIYNLFIPLPPLAEQKRIVAKIEEVFKEIDKLMR